MATHTHYKILHPVLQGTGKTVVRHKRGSVVPASSFNDAEAGRLVEVGSIEPTNEAVHAAPPPVLGLTTLQKLTVAELVAYGISHGRVETALQGLSKDELLSELSQTETAANAMNEANAAAAAHGR